LSHTHLEHLSPCSRAPRANDAFDNVVYNDRSRAIHVPQAHNGSYGCRFRANL